MRFSKILMRWALMLLIVASARAEMLSTFDANGNSQVVWSDDGSYGVQVFNKVDGDGKVRIIEYAKVTDSNFVRDSFTFNTDYTRSSLNEVFGIVGVDTNNIYAVGLSSGGTLDNGNGWSLVDNGDGTHNVNNTGGLSGIDYKIPVQDDYTVRETSMLASDISNGIIVNGVLVNAEPEPYLQIVTQELIEWNLKQVSENGLDIVYSAGTNGYGIGITASTITDLSGVFLGVFDANGQSQIVWSDDGSYGVQVFNKVDGDGTVRILEYATVTDSNFTRDSFTFNTDYTQSPLNNVFELVAIDTNSIYSVGLNSGGTLDNGNGWSLVSNGDGTHNVNNSGYIFGQPIFKVPAFGDYAVKETSMLASNLINGIIVNGILVNAEPEPYLQIVTQEPVEWNLREQSETGFPQLYSTGINGYGIGITASLIFESVPVQLSGRMIQFMTVTNERYLVYSITNLTSNHWMIETNFIGLGTSNTFEMLPLYTNQFFKVEELN